VNMHTLRNPAPFRVLALSGSLRRDSSNTKLLLAAASLAPPGMVITVDAASAHLPLFDEDIESDTFGEGALPELAARVAAADALLIATPEYNHSFPAVLKNTLDWLSRPGARDVLVGKPVAVIGATAGRWGTRLAQAALRQVLFACEAKVMTGPALCLAAAGDAFDASGRLVDPGATASLRDVVAGLWPGADLKTA
jgi:chromate reductase